ncbi:MAG: ATP-binding protein [Acidobacteria bacterium]|jgi:signal transduction histidine kinase|nr:ATP-binding protein [Acidobacteriota bacterium]
MQFTLRQKLFAIFCFLLLIAAFIGIQSINRFNLLGKSIDVILRENYHSVIACQQMKEALERIDSGSLFLLLGYEKDGKELITKNIEIFKTALDAEENNLTLHDEPRKVFQVKSLFTLYIEKLYLIIDKKTSSTHSTYINALLPLFKEIKNTIDEILDMNQQNMNDANNNARRKAAKAQRDMIFFLAAAFCTAVLFLLFSNRWILKPIQRLILSANEITGGNLNLVVEVDTHDEIGRLSEAFNDMVTHLRLLRRSDNSKLLRVQRAAQEVFKNLADAIAIIDLDGIVEIATESAQVHFGLVPNTRISDISYPWLYGFLVKIISNKKIAAKEFKGDVVQHFIDNREKFFQPKAFPILDNEKEFNGLIISLEDVTLLRQSDEIKKDLFSTISHQLKTPLTAIRMAIHLLLEEKIGVLNEKQAELLISARDESVRLFSILEDLLDVSRIESGNVRMNFTAVSPYELVEETVESFRREAQDKGIMLEVNLPAELPEVKADPARIAHVLGNLLSNAVKYTSLGGKVLVSAKAGKGKVIFYVTDNGKGIPKEYQSRIFEKFFRIPGQDRETGGDRGEGLGLAIAKEIIKAHNGEISFKSSEGKGTTFEFSLKRYEE